jgi:hypothetical protein
MGFFVFYLFIFLFQTNDRKRVLYSEVIVVEFVSKGIFEIVRESLGNELDRKLSSHLS